MRQPVGSPSNVPTLRTTVVFTDQVTRSFGVLLSDEDVELVCTNAIMNATDENVSPDFPDLYEFIIPARNIRVLYQFHHDLSKLYLVAAVKMPSRKKQSDQAVKDVTALSEQVGLLKKLKVGIAPRDFLKWLVKRLFRRHDD